MSQGRRGGHAVNASIASTPLAAMSTPSTPDFSAIQKVVRNVFRSSQIKVQQVERLQGRLHQVYLIRLVDGTSLVMKCPPTYNTRLLRCEKHALETQLKTLETLREYTQLSVPQVIKFDHNNGHLGSPFLLMSHLPGRRLSELLDHITSSQRRSIDRALGHAVKSLTALSATQYGLTHRVFSKKGYHSWRDAFLSLLESVLRDAEDMVVTMPYESIRYFVGQHSDYLNEVKEPRLVALDVCDPQNVLVDPQNMHITGLVGFSNVIWGDPLMTDGIFNGSAAFFEGFGEYPARDRGTHARMLLYEIYRATVQIVAHHYRSHLNTDELVARRSLSDALRELAEL
ncbi:hypothetical protein BU24DRAFT_344028 [Aaosphaeria arxii CBS 175.79]|uniref:Aminoglycoside phosphotransferase domain-containing protein n=1 Tax=Aaosphaeria arxii CBS 175.79 TaxID=1450172 RepID=A0A6A5Y0Y8_9PLEO|nr:uncharacterized protein BU24DRAFT_344028 [Aaosphaeria arxii CBS 175.79]KAF2018470.1 hypothetical protein BU24DRAFT_344028 [Aaosphaeria arxii CBS 175.79]